MAVPRKAGPSAVVVLEGFRTGMPKYVRTNLDCHLTAQLDLCPVLSCLAHPLSSCVEMQDSSKETGRGRILASEAQKPE